MTEKRMNARVRAVGVRRHQRASSFTTRVFAASLFTLTVPSAANADVFSNVPEASGYTLVYALDIADIGTNYHVSGVPYAVDNSATTTPTFDRVAYYLELQAPGGSVQFAYASMDTFSTDVAKIGVPIEPTGVRFQQLVQDMNVVSNVAGVASGTGMSGGNIEFWPDNYRPQNSAAVPNASDADYDFGDSPSGPVAGYGSLQIHNHQAGHTIMSFSGWGRTVATDIGIGDAPTGERDWTFSGNSAGYQVKSLSILVRPGPAPALVITAPTTRAVYQRDDAQRAIIDVEGNYDETLGATRVEAQAVVRAGSTGVGTGWRLVDGALANGRFRGRLSATSGYFDVEVRVVGSGGVLGAATVERVGVGEVFLTAGQSNSANHGRPALSAIDERVSMLGPAGWQRARDPQPIATGAGGTPWPPLGDRLAAHYDVPVGFISVGWGGTSVGQWHPVNGIHYPRIASAIDAIGINGLRAVLWHQGESDAAGGTSSAVYAATLQSVIAQSRRDAGFDVLWGVALVGFLPNNPQAAIDAVVDGQRAVIAGDVFVFEGPSTDDLLGPMWRHDAVHFSEAGLREHASRWFDKITATVPAPIPPSPDAGQVDAGHPTDGGITEDAAAVDAGGGEDATTTDAGITDAPPTDAGGSEDATAADTGGSEDATASDTGVSEDATATDAGVTTDAADASAPPSPDAGSHQPDATSSTTPDAGQADLDESGCDCAAAQPHRREQPASLLVLCLIAASFARSSRRRARRPPA